MEANGASLDEQRFPGRQGRIVFAYLAAQKGRPVPRDELAELLWGDQLPATWEKALRVLMSKLRALLEECGIDGSAALKSAFGCYKLTLPGMWIDVDAAVDAVERAEAALAVDDLDEASSRATTAAALARRSFLPGEDGPWVEEKRRDLRDLLLRSLECLREASFGAGEFAEAVRHAEEVTELEPFRESGYRRLMQAHAAAGNPAEALRVYERCRRFLSDELGAFPSAESEAIYLEILRNSPKSSVADVDQLQIDGARSTVPPLAGVPPERRHRKPAVAAALSTLLIAGAAVAAFVLTRGDDAPPEVLPSSVVRIDPKTLKPTQVVRIGPRADLVAVAGGYVWITHGLLRYTNNEGLRNAGDRTLTRVDPATGEARAVGGGLAPCGLTADPSGDVWVANCFASGPRANVVRVNARTLEFEPTWRVPAGAGYFRGMAYGGGSLWLADVSGAADHRAVTQLDPRTGVRRSIRLGRHAAALAWSEGYGDLWMTNFARGSVSRMHAETREVQTRRSVLVNPGPILVHGDGVWVGDWAVPDVARLSAVVSGSRRHISLPVITRPAGVTSVAAGAGAIWATVPDDHAVWRIDLKTNHATRIRLSYFPWGVAAGDDGIWVAVRAHDAA